MTVIEWVSRVVLISAILIAFVVFMYGIIRITRWGVVGKKFVLIARVLAILFGSLVVIYLFCNLGKIEAGYWMEISLLAGLVGVTVIYAWTTRIQADASVRMAEEMREQRRPIVVQQLATHEDALGIQLIANHPATNIPSDYFEIHNVGNGPAIELEVMLLDQEEKLKQEERETFLSHIGKNHLEFHPAGLENLENSTCSLLCRYRSSDEGKMWYLTKLPFVPKKSQRGDRIIIEPQELEFSRASEKQSY